MDVYKCEFCRTEIKHSVWSGFSGIVISKHTGNIYKNPHEVQYENGFLSICNNCKETQYAKIEEKQKEIKEQRDEPTRIKKAVEEAQRKERLKKDEEERVRILNLPKLINCPDCEKEISRRAVACPHCGAPNSELAGASIHHIGVATAPSTPTSTVDIPKCPTCQSIYVEKISLASKAGKVALVGVFAIGKISKTFKCNSCGYQW